MKSFKFIFIFLIVFLIQEKSIGQTSTITRNLGPLQLGMSLENVKEVAGIKEIQPCSREQEKILENFANQDRDCHLLMMLKSEKINGMISSFFNINGLDLTHLRGEAHSMNERIQSLTNNKWNKIEFFFVNNKLSMILIEEPNVNIKYLEDKYGQYQFTDESQNLECINNNGFNDISWFGTKWASWQTPNEKIDIANTKKYSNSRRCSVENWNYQTTFMFRDKKLWEIWEGAFNFYAKNQPKKKSDF